MSDVTRILQSLDAGDQNAANKLLPLVYDELRKLAKSRLACEQGEQTLQATALVHEAYVRLVNNADEIQWNGRGHFFGAAAEAMRRILVDVARMKSAQKRGGGRQRIDWDRLVHPGISRPERLLALDSALALLERKHKIKGELVKLRFFAGFTNKQAAEALGISSSTADRYWAFARAWLQAEIDDAEA